MLEFSGLLEISVSFGNTLRTYSYIYFFIFYLVIRFLFSIYSFSLCWHVLQQCHQKQRIVYHHLLLLNRNVVFNLCSNVPSLYALLAPGLSSEKWDVPKIAKYQVCLLFYIWLSLMESSHLSRGILRFLQSTYYYKCFLFQTMSELNGGNLCLSRVFHLGLSSDKLPEDAGPIFSLTSSKDRR